MELMTNGPMEASFSVYEDFPHYKSGVYQHIYGKFISDHAVRLLGWGEEGSVVHSHWSRNVEARLSLVESFIVLLRQLSYAIKNQLGHPKPPTTRWVFEFQSP